MERMNWIEPSGSPPSAALRARTGMGDMTEARNKRPEISRFMFAMFDVLGFSGWLTQVGLEAVLDSYHQLIER